MGGWWKWALVSPDGVTPSWMISVSASVNLPLRHKVQKFSSGTGSPGWSQKKGRKMVVVWCGSGLTKATAHPATKSGSLQRPTSNKRCSTSSADQAGGGLQPFYSAENHVDKYLFCQIAREQ